MPTAAHLPLWRIKMSPAIVKYGLGPAEKSRPTHPNITCWRTLFPSYTCIRWNQIKYSFHKYSQRTYHVPGIGVRDPVVNKKDNVTFSREQINIFKWCKVLRYGHWDTRGAGWSVAPHPGHARDQGRKAHHFSMSWASLRGRAEGRHNPSPPPSRLPSLGISSGYFLPQKPKPNTTTKTFPSV